MNIVWSCSIDLSGYSSCARDYTKSLYENKRCNINFIANNVARNINTLGLDKKELDFFSSIATNQVEKNEILIQHAVPDRMIFGNKKEILYTVCETKIPKRWVSICNRCDLIMTASNFCKEKMLESGCNVPIHVVPHTFDTTKWNINIKPLNISNLKKYNFLTIADFTPRKNCKMLIKSFIKTFKNNKDVSLTIKAYYNSFEKQDKINLINRIKKIADSTNIPKEERPCIFFYGEPILENLLPRFMMSFDCLVSPHRGEGYGLTLSQMMSLGKPVISTNYSGNLDFMNEENSYLIDTSGFEPVTEEMIVINPNYEDQNWVIIDESSLCEKMKYVFENQIEAKNKGKIAAKNIKKKTSYKVISNQILDLLEANN